MFMDAPPDNPMAVMGDNSRHFDIMRVADEIRYRLEYNSAFVVPAKTYKWKVLHSANNSEMSDAAFRLLFNYLTYAKDDGSESYPSHKRVATVTRRTERSIARAAKELDKDGWIETERQRRGSAVRKVVIPDFIAKEVLRQYLETTNLTDLKTPLEVPDLSSPKSETTNASHQGSAQERTKSVSRSDRSFAPIEEPVLNQGGSSGAREASCGPLEPQPEKIEVADYEAYNKLFNSWGRKPGTNMFPVSRATTDCLLDGVFRTQPKEPEIVLTAIRHVTALMLAKTAMAPPGTSGPAGFPNYFQKVLVGWVKELKALEAAPSQAPPTVHWRDEEREKTRKTADNMAKVRAQFAEKNRG